MFSNFSKDPREHRRYYYYGSLNVLDIGSHKNQSIKKQLLNCGFRISDISQSGVGALTDRKTFNTLKKLQEGNSEILAEINLNGINNQKFQFATEIVWVKKSPVVPICRLGLRLKEDNELYRTYITNIDKFPSRKIDSYTLFLFLSKVPTKLILILKSTKILIRSMRDLVAILAPSWFGSLLIPKADFVFLAHPLDFPDLIKQYPILRWLPKKFSKMMSRFLWPVIGSEITGFKKQDGSVTKGLVIFCPLTTRMMLLKRRLARKRLLTASHLATLSRAPYLGLGAFVPIVTEDGKLLKKKIDMFITSGSTFSAVIALENALTAARIIETNPENSEIAIIGAAGSVGSILTKLAIEHFGKLILVDKNKFALEKLVRLISEEKKIDVNILTIMDKIPKQLDASFVITTTNTPGAIILPSHLRPGTVIIDAAFPRIVSKRVLKERKDVLVIDSGIVKASGVHTNFDFGLKNQEEVFSCLGELLLLIWSSNRIKKENIKDDHAYAFYLLEISKQAGIHLINQRSGRNVIPRSEYLRIKTHTQEIR